MDTTSPFSVVGRVLLVGCMSALLPQLKWGSLTTPSLEPSACQEAMHAGASCEVCTSKFKLCKGHFVFEPFTLVLFESFATIVLGVLATVLAVGHRSAPSMLLNWSSIRRVGPVGMTYALGDFVDLIAASKCSATTLLVASQMRLPLCALLRSALLGRGQSKSQWGVLWLISGLCVAHVMHDMGAGASPSTSDLAVSELFIVMPLVMGKCIVSCVGAVHAEYFLQGSEAQHVPLSVTQTHFKAATMLGAIIMGVCQGRRGGRIFASTWQENLFVLLPQGVRPGDARTPFFGGWSATTWILVVSLIANNFIIGDQLRKLSAVSKYVAYAVGIVFSFSGQVLIGGKDLDLLQAACCGSIAGLAMVYVSLPSPGSARQKGE